MSKTRPSTEVPAKPARSRRVASRAAAAKTPKMAAAPPRRNRAERTAERRAAIVEAALDEFIARGFTATRLDDVAKRAGVAKGTIYLHFKDKESMFEELIRTALVPMIGRLHAPPPIGGSVRDMIEGFARQFHPGSREHAARRHRPPDRRGGPALSGHRRFLLPRSGVARPRRHARADRARHRARRDPAQEPGALSADHGGARADRGDLAEPVCASTRRWMRSRCFASISI